MTDRAEVQATVLRENVASEDTREAKRTMRAALPHLFRWGSLVIVLAVWEWLGPSINPLFFSYPSAIVDAFFELLASGGPIGRPMWPGSWPGRSALPKRSETRGVCHRLTRVDRGATI